MKHIIFFLSLIVSLFGANKNVTSKVYLSEVEGTPTVLLDSGEVKTLSNKDVYNAEGLVFKTNENSNLTMVLSNSAGIYLSKSTQLEIKKFSQAPFTPHRSDLEVEPSISQTNVYIPYGLVAICTPKIVAGSNMLCETPHGEIRLENNKISIRVNADSTEIISIYGEYSVKVSVDKIETIAANEKCIITKNKIFVTRASKEEIKQISENITFACDARKSVYFDLKRPIFGGFPNIEVLPVIKTTVPVDLTVSRSRL